MTITEGATYQLKGAYEGEKKEFLVKDASGAKNIYGELNGAFHVIPRSKASRAFKGANRI